MNTKPKEICGRTLTVKALAEISGLSQGYCCSILSRRVMPGLHGLRKMAIALGVDIQQLYDELDGNGKKAKRRKTA